jgi:hypothetical protein
MNGNGNVDPFLALTSTVRAVDESVADANQKQYRAAIEQTNDINERAYQSFIWKTNTLAGIKSGMTKATHAAQIAQARTEAHEQYSHGEEQVTALESADSQKDLYNTLNAQNLSTSIINTTTAVVGSQGQNQGLQGAVAGAVAATQIATSVSAVNAVSSATSGQGMVNTGFMECVDQSASPTSIG